MKMEKTSKWFAFVLVALMFVALMPIAVKPAAAANPDTTDWIPDQMVSTGTVRSDRRPSITTGRYGSLYVAYEHYNPTTMKYEIKVARGARGGTSWSVIYTYSDSLHNLYRPSIAVDPYRGQIYVAFEHYVTSTNVDIWLIRYTAYTWSRKTVDGTGNNRYPSITVEYDRGLSNYVYIAYEDQISTTDYDLMFAKSTDHGATWTVTTRRNTLDRVHAPSITYADGWLYIAYRHGNATFGHIDLYRSSDRGVTWLGEYSINSGSTTNDCSDPSIVATYGLGVVVVAYTYASSSTNDDIRTNYSTDYGNTWSSYSLVASSTANERWPHLTVDGMGRIYTTYIGNIHITYEKSETVGSRTNGVYYMKTTAAAPYWWSYREQVADDDAKASWGNPKYADRTITTVRDNVPVIVWTDYRNSTTDYDVYATTLGGEYTIDTKPSNLKVRVDGTYYSAPVSFYWALGSSHSLFALSPQGPHSFVSWSDGGAQSHTHVASTTAEELIMAYFTPTLTLSISPSTVARGSPITYSGQLTPGVATTISLYYRWSGTFTWHFGVTMSTDATGAYSSTFTVPLSAPTGTVYIVVAWYDSATNRYAVSESKQQVIT